MQQSVDTVFCVVLTVDVLFFQIVPPDGNTTFDVVFLARQEGNVENTLYIHTSLGSFKYQVSIGMNSFYYIYSVINQGPVVQN